MENEPKLEQNPGFFKDLISFMLQNKKWWLAPIVIVIVLIGGILILGGTSAAPFIYSLF